MHLKRAALAVLPVATVALTVPFLAPAPVFAAEAVSVELQELGKSGAKGSAVLTPMDNGDLKIVLKSTGMTPNSPHAQHLHGSAGGMDFHCPTLADDKNGNGYLSVEEGLPMYGDIFVSLTTSGDTTKASGLAVDRFPTADAQGNLSYERTIPAAQLPAGGVETGDGSSLAQSTMDPAMIYAIGGTAVAGTLAVAFYRRRKTVQV